MDSLFKKAAWLLWAAILLPPLSAQAPNFAFTYRSSVTQTTVSVSPTGTVNFSSAPVGASNSVTFIVSNRETTPWLIAEFTVSGSPFQRTLGAAGEIGPGEDRLFGLSFTPTVRGLAEGTLNLRLTNNARSVQVTFFLAGAGLAPELIFSYILAAEGNQIILGANDTIDFPPTLVGQSSTGTFVVSNRGNGPGTVGRIVLTGAAFRLSGLPLLPTQIAPDRELRFTIVFAPASQDRSSGSLRVEFEDSVKTVSLNGQGAGATLVYEVAVGAAVTSVAANGTVTLPPTNVGATTSALVRVRNTGNAETRIAGIAIAGTGFQTANLPFLPATVLPGESIAFNIAFAPAQSGQAEGRLRIDNTVINLVATGVGSSLSLAVRQGISTTPLADNSAVTFPNTTVGQRTVAAIQITNNGNAPTTVNSISLSGEAYLLESLPDLPATLAPGQGLEFATVFAPAALGAAAGTLRVDGFRINLVGVGVAPPALSAVSFFGVADSAEAAQQLLVGLTLAAPYPLDLSGRLALSFTTDAFVDDPAIQFAAGGRSVNFLIPANTTRAIFTQDATQVAFQTGTVAGTITITATFSTGAVNVTPAPAPVKTVLVGPSAPRIRSVQMGARTATSFDVIVTGFSTPRLVSQMTLQFTPTPGSNLQTTTLSVNVEPAFTAWYQSTSSTQFGSQFTAVLSIGVTGDINSVQSVAVTASNARGVSAPASANLR